MTDKVMIERETLLCSHCRFPLPKSYSGLRHYGTHTAHQENECLRLLHAEIERLRAALAAQPVEPAAWRHDCAGLCTNDVELWIDACPHCGKPRTHTAPPAPAALTDEWAADVLGIAHDTLPVSEFSAHQRERIACVLAGARAVLAAGDKP